MSSCYWYFQGFDGGDCVGICAIAEVSNKLALEINSKTETTRATIEKPRTIERSRNSDCSLRDFTLNLPELQPELNNSLFAF